MIRSPNKSKASKLYDSHLSVSLCTTKRGHIVFNVLYKRTTTFNPRTSCDTYLGSMHPKKFNTMEYSFSSSFVQLSKENK